ncbi:hypothetical protein EYC80_006345 [Monilinia laxa]|uniref:Uncharacterized protein n=1 Tax=Monilinia laxa TaxID=61186 RepID=A0A5N6JUK2_MONLA|nr:hypothetical protein EYC80_006345 [Monilinia laxa]
MTTQQYLRNFQKEALKDNLLLWWILGEKERLRICISLCFKITFIRPFIIKAKHYFEKNPRTRWQIQNPKHPSSSNIPGQERLLQYISRVPFLNQYGNPRRWNIPMKQRITTIGDGDWWMSDEDAPIVTDDVGNRNNLLTVPVKPSSPAKSVSHEKSLEESSTPRTIPDFVSKEIEMENPIEPAQHTEAESEDKLPEISHPETSVSAADSSSIIPSSDVEVTPEKTEEAHGTSLPEGQTDHAVESEKETSAKELDLSSVPVEELEVSNSGVDEPESWKSHTHPETTEESKTTTTEVPDSKPTFTTQEANEVSKEPLDVTNAAESEEIKTKDADEVHHVETGTTKDGIVEQQQEPTPAASEKLDSEEESLAVEGGVKEDTAPKTDEDLEQQQEPVLTALEKLGLAEETPVSEQTPVSEDGAKEETVTKDEVPEHKEELAHVAIEEPESKQEPHTSEVEAKEETGTDKVEALEHQEDSTPITIEEPHSNQEAHISKTNEESALVPTEEPTFKQELHVDESEIKEDPIPTHIEEPESVREPLASEGKAKEATELADIHAPEEDEQTEDPETSQAQDNEVSTSNPILLDDSIEDLSEELEKEVSQSSEISTSNPVLPDDDIKNVVEEPSPIEQVVAEDTGATSKQEHTTPIEVEEPDENTTSVNESVAQEDDHSKSIDVEEISTIEIPADEAIDVPEPNHEINSTSKESLDQDNVDQKKSDESIEITKNTTETNEQASIPSEVVSAPIVTVEKVDSEARHGDDFGSDATVAQKDAHALHARDAVPDQVTIRQEATTPELANVAAEVADSAELLDEAPPTPPMSDKEAGEFGDRRLSHTPIPEVAETAAEVADIAAQIDENFKPTVIQLPTPKPDTASGGLDGLERDLDIETPSEERAPLFAHECGCLPTAEDRIEHESAQSRSSIPEPIFKEFDPNDPSLEPFPSDFNQILEHVRRLENRLSEDQTDFEGSPLSPVATNGSHHAEAADFPIPSIQPLEHESSPSLLPIAEENAEGEPESELTALPPSIEKSQSDGNLSDESKKDGGEQAPGADDAEISERASQDSISQLPSIRAPRSSSPRRPGMKLDESPSKLHPVLPTLPPTPFVENKPLNLEGSAQGSPNTEEGRNSPTITVQPATPAASVNTEAHDSVPKEKAAKSTSFAEENGDSQLRARKQPASHAPDRSITPSSMRSAGNDAKSRNFLRAFFQVVFVDWIGGLIRKLCGGGRHTLLAVPALFIAVTAPILYFSGLANFGFGLGS